MLVRATLGSFNAKDEDGVETRGRKEERDGRLSWIVHMKAIVVLVWSWVMPEQT